MNFPKHYSLHTDNEDHFLVHDSRDNKKFKVAKKELHPANQIKIMKMQKFKDGGGVNGEDVGMDSGINIKDAPRDEYNDRPWYANYIGNNPDQPEPPKDLRHGPRIEDFAENPNYVPYGSHAPSGETTTQPPSPVIAGPAPTSAPGPGPASVPDQSTQAAPVQDQMSGIPTVGSLNKIEGQYENAINIGAQGQIEQNKQMAALYQPKIEAQERATQDYQEASQRYMKQADEMSQQIANQKIDPNAYFHNKSVGSKIITGLSIILGGIGQGLSGSSSNAAMDVINKNIDRDIDSQKAELGKKQTLLSDNLRMQGNLAAAESATRAQYESIFQGKLQQMAAKTGNPMILAGAQKAIMESRLRMQQYLQPVVQNQMSMKMREHLMKGDVSGQDPASYVPYVVPEARQKEVFEEIKNAQNTKSLAPKIMEAFERGSSRNPVIAAQGQREFEGLINTTVTDLEGTARQAAFDSIHKNMNPSGTFASPGENAAKKRTVLEYLGAKASAPSAKGFGIDLEKFGSTSRPGPGTAMEGKTATNSSGQKIIMKNGKWVPFGS